MSSKPWTIYYEPRVRTRWWHFLFWFWNHPYVVTSASGWVETVTSTKRGARRRLRKAKIRNEEERRQDEEGMRHPFWENEVIAP